MKHLAAYALLVLGGNESPSAADVEKLLKASGCTADSEKIAAMIKAFDGKPFNEMVEGGLKKLSSMGTGAAAPTAAAGGAKVEAAKEEEKEEEEDVDMGGLFGGDDDEY